MNAHLIVAQAQTYVPGVPVVLVQALLQEYLSNHNNQGRSEFITISDIPDDTYYTAVPDGVNTIHKMYLNGNPVAMNYTEEEYMNAANYAIGTSNYRAYAGDDRIIRMNFTVNTASSSNDLIVKATIRTAFTIQTLPSAHENPALFYISFRIHQMPLYKDPIMAKNYYTMFEEAYEQIRYHATQAPFRNIGSGL